MGKYFISDLCSQWDIKACSYQIDNNQGKNKSKFLKLNNCNEISIESTKYTLCSRKINFQDENKLEV